jgi:hypothetical protein
MTVRSTAPAAGPGSGAAGTGRCCIWTIHGMLKPRPPVRDQIAKASSSNAAASRRFPGTSTASS